MRKQLLALSSWVIGVWALYALAVLVFLNTGLFSQVVALEPDARIKIGFGWSIFPGQIEIRNTSIEGEDLNVKWVVEMKRTSIDLHMGDLLRKQFHTRRVLARGVDFNLHLKTDEEKTQDAPIYGNFWPPGWSKEQIEGARQGALRRRLVSRWKVRLENVSVERLSGLHVESFALDGTTEQALSVAGRLDLWPGILAEIGPIRLSAPESELVIGGKSIAHFKEFEKRVHVRPFYTDFKDTTDVLAGMKLDAHARGELAAGGVGKGRLFELPKVVGKTQKPAVINLDLAIDGGRILDTTRARIDLPQIRMLLGAWNLEATGSLDIEGVKMQSRLSQIAFRRRLDQHLVAIGKGARFDAAASDNRLSKVASTWKWDASLSQAQVVDLEPAVYSLVRGFTDLKLAETKASLNLRASSHQPGSLELKVEKVSGKLGVRPFSAYGSFVSRLGKVGFFPLSASMSGGALQLNSGEWWARTEIPEASVKISSKGTFANGNVRVTLKDSSPLMVLYELDKKIPVIARKLLDEKEVVGSSQVSIAGDQIDLRSLELRAGTVNLNGNLSIDAAQVPVDRMGRFVMRLGLLPVGIRVNDLDADVKVFPSDEWLASGL